VLIAVVAVILLIIWAPWKYFGPSEGSRPTAMQQVAPAENATLPVLALEGFPFLPEDHEAAESRVAGESIALRIEATGDARVIVNVDDRRNIFRDLQAGSVWTVLGEEYFFFSALDPDKLALSLDGEVLVLPQAPGGGISGWRIDAASVGRAP